MRSFTIWLLSLLLLGCGGGAEAAKLVKGSRGAVVSTLTPSASQTRTTCISPCYVFFDAMATTSTQTSYPFHEVEYTFNFDDAGSGTWGQGAQVGVSSKNTHRGGPIAGHIYETAGANRTVTPTGTATDGVSTAALPGLSSITITDPDLAPEFAGGKTICVSNTTDHTGCPAGATQQSSITSLATAIGYLGTTVNGSVVKRLLLHADHEWTATTTITKATSGPLLIGKYGSGAKPKWTLDASFTAAWLFRMGNSVQGSSDDWRIMDIHVDGSAVPYPRRQATFNAAGSLVQLTILRIDYTNMNLGVEFTDTQLGINNRTQPGQIVWDQLAIVDNMQLSPADSSNIFDFFSCERCFYAGNYVDVAGLGTDTTKSHDVRCQYCYKAIFANNYLANPGAGVTARHMIKLHGPTWKESSVGAGDWQPAMIETDNSLVHPDNASGGAVLAATTTGGGAGTSRYVIISDNKLAHTLATNPGGWMLSLGPADNVNFSLVQDIIVERNWHVSNTNTLSAIESQTQRLTVRNNLWDLSTAGEHVGFFSVIRHASVPSTDPWIYHNTGNHSDGATGEFLIEIQAGTTGAIVKNNLVYGVGDTTGGLLTDAGTGTVAGFNTGNVGAITTDPLFVGARSAVTGWALQAGSYGVNAGTSVPVFSDFFGNPRPTGGARDLGAAER